MRRPEPPERETKVAVVTGGGRGIGRAIAQTLGKAGAAVAVLARTAGEIAETVRLVESGGGRARGLTADITDLTAVQEAMRTAEESFGPVDLLVNNAGAVKPFGPFWENDPEEWWRSLEVNLRGAMLCSRAVLPGMVSRKRGWIVNVSSGAGTMASPYYSSYVTSKTALVRFSECLALECKPHGIAVFAISPGTVRTRMSEYSLNSPDGQKWLPWLRRIFDEKINVSADRPAQLVLELSSGRFDALSGCMISIFDDLELLRDRASEIEGQNLYSLRLQKLKGAETNPAMAVLAAARVTAKPVR